MTKTCKKCGVEKALDAFYANDNSCKECRKAAVKANRTANIERYRAFDRARASLPHRVAAREAYQETGAYRASHAAANRRYFEAYPERNRARVMVNNAIRDRRLHKAPCLICGSTEVEGHHPDYSAPLDVVWLCKPHHDETHALVAEVQQWQFI
jgi:hypothetical protein